MTVQTKRADVLRVLEAAKKTGLEIVAKGENKWSLACPLPGHRGEGLGVDMTAKEDKIILFCKDCGKGAVDLVAALDLEMSDLFLHPYSGPVATVEELAIARGLSPEFLSGLGCRSTVEGVEIPVYDETGNELFARVYKYVKGDSVRQPKGESLRVYGLERMGAARNAGELHIVGGEIDCWTLWEAGFPAVALPRAPGKSKLVDSLDLSGIDTVYVVRPNNTSGDDFADAVLGRLSKNATFRGDVRKVWPPAGCPWINDMLVKAGADFPEAWQARTRAEGRGQAGQSGTPTYYSLAELGESTLSDPDWIVHGLVAPGLLTSLTAAHKTGKTAFILSLCKAVSEGTPFLGLATRRARVIYLSEEAKQSFRRATERASLRQGRDMEVAFRPEHRTSWEELVRRTAKRAKRTGAEILVVDTFAGQTNLMGEEENNAAAVAQALRPLQEAKAQGLAILIALHSGKAGAEDGQLARGSSAFGAEADIILELRRHGGGNLRQLKGTHGRFPEETPQRTLLGFEHNHYVAIDEETHIPPKQAAILSLVEAAGAEGIPRKEVVAQDGRASTTVDREIKSLEKKGKLVSEPIEGARGGARKLLLPDHRAA